MNLTKMSLPLLLSSIIALVHSTDGPLTICALFNHPDGDHNPPGEALYGLVMTDFHGEERILFDFNHNRAGMKLAVYKKDRLRIFGRAMARVQVDGLWEPAGLWRINFFYRNTIDVVNGGVPDLKVMGSNNSYGSFINLESGDKYELYNKANNANISFLLGDRNGNGYRLTEDAMANLTSGGQSVIEGIGWVNIVGEEEKYYPEPRDFVFVGMDCF